MKKYVILKLIGLCVLSMMVLVMISILEVAVYSYLINPDQDMAVYDAHAELTAPYISGIFGLIVFFLVARYWKKKQYENGLRLAIMFPLVYVLKDIIIITAAGVKWSEFIVIFLLANGAKFLGSYAGYRLSKSVS